jgi:Rhodanese-like domain
MRTRFWSIFALLLSLLLVSPIQAQSASNIYTATLGESGVKTPEISTEELRSILAERSAMVFDVRSGMEFASGHIPGAVNVAQKPGTSKALYVSDVVEIGPLLGNDKAKPVGAVLQWSLLWKEQACQ